MIFHELFFGFVNVLRVALFIEAAVEHSGGARAQDKFSSGNKLSV